MLKLLRRRFVFTAMTAISLLLLILLGFINIGNMYINQRQTNRIIDKLVASEGLYTPPEPPNPTEQPQPKLDWPDFSMRPTEDDMMGARYFFVRFDKDGKVSAVNVNHIYAVEIAEAEALAQGIYQRNTSSGHTGHFRFHVAQALDEQSTIVLFLDIYPQIRSIWAVLLISLGVGLVCWLGMLLLVLLLSQKAIAPLAENIEKQKQFVTNAGHEIKTPLSIIQVNIDALELHQGSSKWSQNISGQVVRLSELMKNLLALAKMDENVGKLPLELVSATSLLEEVLQPYYELAANKQIKLQCNLQPDVVVSANRESLSQLFSILIDNALKYTPVAGHIELTLSVKRRGMMFQIKNSYDLPEKIDLAKLFERFYRYDDARTQKNGGYGIGLSAARAICQAHGGSITASFDDTDNIVFTVLI